MTDKLPSVLGLLYQALVPESLRRATIAYHGSVLQFTKADIICIGTLVIGSSPID